MCSLLLFLFFILGMAELANAVRCMISLDGCYL